MNKNVQNRSKKNKSKNVQNQSKQNKALSGSGARTNVSDEATPPAKTLIPKKNMDKNVQNRSKQDMALSGSGARTQVSDEATPPTVNVTWMETWLQALYAEKRAIALLAIFSFMVFMLAFIAKSYIGDFGLSSNSNHSYKLSGKSQFQFPPTHYLSKETEQLLELEPNEENVDQLDLQ